MGVLVNESACEAAVAVNAAVAQERPPAAHGFRALHVHFDNCGLFHVGRGLIQKFALGAGNEARAPECDAVGLRGRVGFVTYAVYGHHWQSVGHGMAALHGDPGFALTRLFVGSVG